MKTKMPLRKAQQVAGEILGCLAPACDRIVVAGSIRREKPEVGDIEIVCIPAYAKRVETDLLGETVVRWVNLLDGLLRNYAMDGYWKFVKGGPAYKQFVIDGVPLDLYITTPEKWGVIFTLRTGSAEFGKRLVTPKRYGGLLPSYLKIKDGRVWHGEKALETPEEADVFKAIGLEWIEPKDRTK